MLEVGHPATGDRPILLVLDRIAEQSLDVGPVSIPQLRRVDVLAVNGPVDNRGAVAGREHEDAMLEAHLSGGHGRVVKRIGGGSTEGSTNRLVTRINLGSEGLILAPEW